MLHTPRPALHASQSIHARPALPPRSLPLSCFHASHSIRARRSTLHFRLAPSSGAPPKLFPRFTIHHARPALPSRSLQRSSPQAISTLQNPSTLVRRFRLAPSSGDPPKLFPRFPLRPRSCLPSFLPFFLPFFLSFFLPSCLPSCLPSFPLSFLPSFLPSLLVRLFCLAPLAAKETKREPKNRRWFWGKTEKSVTPILHCRPTASTDSLSCVPTPRKPSMRQVLISDKGQFLE